MDNMKRSRPSYKYRAGLWRTLFWICFLALTVVSAFLGWSLNRNKVLIESFCNSGITAVVE